MQHVYKHFQFLFILIVVYWCRKILLDDEFCELRKFQRNNSPTYKGGYDPEGAQTWLREIKKIFWVMACIKEQQVLFGTYLLSVQDED